MAAVHFDQQNRGRFHGQAGLGVGFHVLDAALVHDFQGAGHDVGSDNPGHGFRGLVDVGVHGHHGFGSLGRGHELENDVGENTQRAFGARHEPGHVITGNAFDRARAGFHQFAAIVENFHAHDIVFGHAVFQAAQAPGVHGHVAAQGGHGLRTGVRRIEQAALGHGGRELGRDHAGLDHCVQVFLVDLNDLVQFVCQNDKAVAFRGNDAAGQVGARTAHGNGQIAVIRQFYHFAQLLLRGRADDQSRHHRGEHRGVIGIRHAVGFFRQDVFLAGNADKLFYKSRTDCHESNLTMVFPPDAFPGRGRIYCRM